MAQERLQKILSQAGISSRRQAEELIRLGSVTVNGKTAQIGDKADLSSDSVKVNGRLLKGTRPPIYVAFHKPRSVISMFSDPQGRPTIAGYLDRIRDRLFPVGRLDFNSEGLILLTNDGDFAEKLQKRPDVARVYHVKTKGHPDPAIIAKLTKGARFENRVVQPHSVRMIEKFTSKALIEVVMVGAGAMDIKALFERRGLLVDRIVRVSIGHITLHGLKPGEFRYLKGSQVLALLNQPELGMRMIEDEQRRSFRAPNPRDDEDKEPTRVVPVGGSRVAAKVTPRSTAPRAVIKPRSASPRARVTPRTEIRKRK